MIAGCYDLCPGCEKLFGMLFCQRLAVINIFAVNDHGFGIVFFGKRF